MNWIISFVKSLFASPPTPPLPETPLSTPETLVLNEVPLPREKIYQTCLLWLGRDASPSDLADDEFGCAETVWNILNSAFPGKVGFPLTLSTNKLYDGLTHSSLYARVAEPLPGDIILCVTGQGFYPHGHTGFIANFGILSNDSATGLFRENYTLESWTTYFKKKGGFPIFFFRRVVE